MATQESGPPYGQSLVSKLTVGTASVQHCDPGARSHLPELLQRLSTYTAFLDSSYPCASGIRYPVREESSGATSQGEAPNTLGLMSELGLANHTPQQSHSLMKGLGHTQSSLSQHLWCPLPRRTNH